MGNKSVPTLNVCALVCKYPAQSCHLYLEIITLSEVAAKDEFLNIKNVSRDDMLATHRVPPQLMGIIPTNTGGFGDVEKAARVFVRNELTPLQKRLQELNDWLDDELITFDPYMLNDVE